MTIPFLCVLIAFLLIYLGKIPFAIAMNQMPGGYDNQNPRDQQAQLSGWGKRAFSAHQNSFEAFAPFAAAVIIAHLTHANPIWSARLSITFVVARIFYSIFYLANWDKLRSLIWLVGIFCTVGLFALPFFT
jgi:uncharacterized MAPEG superfamily protein